MPRKSVVVFVVFALVSGTICSGQSTFVTRTALLQTRLIQSTKGIGTAFVVEVDRREYWITAKHIFTGIENAPPGVFTARTVEANLLYPYAKSDAGDERWRAVRFATIDPGKDIDILVLVPGESLTRGLPPDSMKPASDTDPADVNALVSIGGDCEFFGYPYGGGWKANTPAYIRGKQSNPPAPGNAVKLPVPTDVWFWSPFVKRCALSGSIVRNGITVFVLDGINNLGFSGGPVVTRDGAAPEVFAVVSGFRAEPLEVLPEPEQGQAHIGPPPDRKPASGKKQIVEANSGLILAYDLTPAIKAIRENPIGPAMYPEINTTKPK